MHRPIERSETLNCINLHKNSLQCVDVPACVTKRAGIPFIAWVTMRLIAESP